jgi:hypothetical protein
MQKSFPTSKKTQRFSIAKISWLMLFKEVTAVYSEKHTKPINIQSLIMKQVVHIVTTGLQRAKLGQNRFIPRRFPIVVLFDADGLDLCSFYSVRLFT